MFVNKLSRFIFFWHIITIRIISSDLGYEIQLSCIGRTIEYSAYDMEESTMRLVQSYYGSVYCEIF